MDLLSPRSVAQLSRDDAGCENLGQSLAHAPCFTTAVIANMLIMKLFPLIARGVSLHPLPGPGGGREQLGEGPHHCPASPVPSPLQERPPGSKLCCGGGGGLRIREGREGTLPSSSLHALTAHIHCPTPNPRPPARPAATAALFRPRRDQHFSGPEPAGASSGLGRRRQGRREMGLLFPAFKLELRSPPT